MRTVLDELTVVASAARLPAAGETARVGLGRSGPTGRGEHADLPAFAEDPRDHPDVPGQLRRRIDRFSAVAHLAVADALSAVADPPARERIGVFLANTRAGWAYGEPELALLVDDGPAAMHAYQATAWFPAAAQGEVTIALDLRGCAKTTAGRAGGFGEALWLARDALERDAVDLAVVGAAESLVNGFVLRDWSTGSALPASGFAEGAVVFAVRRRNGAAAAVLRDLHHIPELGPAGEAEWAPTLSAAGRLYDAVSNPGDPAGDLAVAVGGGYRITVTHEK
jgi:3-oxoacyl-(acyl-carrier-protein) synthase